MAHVVGTLGPGAAPYAFTSREGGASLGAYKSLNLSHKMGDLGAHVRHNRALAAGLIARPPESLINVNQVHGNEVVQVMAQASPHIEADGLITQDTRATLAILVADCVPIVLTSPTADTVAAVHAGWRGTALRIASVAAARTSTVAHSAVSDLWAHVGPAIGPCCFVVDAPVIEALKEAYPTSMDAFSGRGHERMAIDLWALNIRALMDAGIPEDHIGLSRICTHCSAAHFSHRRDGAPNGRQGALIARPSRAQLLPKGP